MVVLRNWTGAGRITYTEIPLTAGFTWSVLVLIALVCVSAMLWSYRGFVAYLTPRGKGPIMAAPVVDFLLQHAQEITAVELEVDQTWNAVQDADNGQLARDLLANGLNEEHFVASLDPDPSKRTPDQLATLAALHGITQQFLAKARIFLAGTVDNRVG